MRNIGALIIMLLLSGAIPASGTAQEINYGGGWFARVNPDCRDHFDVVINPTGQTVDIYGLEVFTGIYPVYRIDAAMRLVELARADINVGIWRYSPDPTRNGTWVHNHVRDAYSNRGVCQGVYGLDGQLVVACEDPSGVEGATSHAVFPVPVTILPGEGLSLGTHCGPIDGVQTPLHVAVGVRGYVANPVTPPGETVADFIQGLYHHALGRGAEPAGLAWYTRLMMESCTLETLQDIPYGFFTGPEYMSHLPMTPAQAVVALYGALLARAPDPGGQSTWESRLRDGLPLGIAVDEMTDGVEYRARVARLCGGPQ